MRHLRVVMVPIRTTVGGGRPVVSVPYRIGDDLYEPMLEPEAKEVTADPGAERIGDEPPAEVFTNGTSPEAEAGAKRTVTVTRIHVDDDGGQELEQLT